jgi:Flp pilus assembly protein TadG
MPLLVTLLLGVWDLGRLIDATQILNNAAREGGRAASTGKNSLAAVQSTVLNYLAQAGIPTTNVNVTWTDITTPSNTDPTTATQLDQFQITVTLPSSNVRWISLSNLIGSSTLTATTYWYSMNDVPLTLPSSIPIN